MHDRFGATGSPGWLIDKYQLLVPISSGMGRNTSILLGEHFEMFINEQIASGRYSSVSEVVRTALRMFETEENKVQALIGELKKGEKSGRVKNFDRNEHLKKLHSTYRK